MARTYSQTITLGTPAPDFRLPVTNPEADGLAGDTRSLGDYGAAPVLVVVFTCNHCPYAQHVEGTLVDLAWTYAARGVAFVAISPNDPDQYPADGPEAMAERAQKRQYPFAYLFDAEQEAATAYGAVCTPDVYVYDRERRLAYHGRVDETRPDMGEAHGADLRQALEAALAGAPAPEPQYPSMGCSIKWKPGRAPAL